MQLRELLACSNFSDSKESSTIDGVLYNLRPLVAFQITGTQKCHVADVGRRHVFSGHLGFLRYGFV